MQDDEMEECIEGMYLLPLVTLLNLWHKPVSMCYFSHGRNILANSIEIYEILQNSSPNQFTVQLRKWR